jgi:hypothetical protein
VRKKRLQDPSAMSDDAMHALERLADVTQNTQPTNASQAPTNQINHNQSKEVTMVSSKSIFSDFQILGRLSVWQAMLSLQPTHIESGGPNFWSLKESRIYMVSME